MSGSAKIWLPLLSLAGVVWLLILDLERTSPGPITQTHAQAPELLESTNCKLCHGDGAETLADACSECHAEIGEDLATSTGFHGTLADLDPAGVEPADCGRCHEEHHGEDFALVSGKSFVLAGLESREEFDHAAIDFTLEGRHAELGCVECHENADLLLIPQGRQRFLGLDRGCVACHEDVHEGRIVRDCAACHGQAHPFEEVASFAHARFVADGAHARAVCSDCHAAETERSVEALAGPNPSKKQLACVDCHASPHSRPFLTTVADLTEARPKESCELCHTASHEDFAGHADAMPVELHAASGFPLDAPHDQAACDACHDAASESPGADAPAAFAQQFPGRRPDDCAACHEDVHAGQFDGGPFAGCLDCHQRHTFQPVAFDLAEHALTAFELEGSHAALACGACHLEPEPGQPRIFADTPSTCASCHEDPHRDAFTEQAESCDLCHQPTLFAEIEGGDFDHERFTAFPLDGAHTRAECTACHPRTATPDAHGRTFGFVHDAFGTPVDACATCHADPHWSSFEREGVPARIEGREGCARCHLTESFGEPALDDFDHGRWTGYRLEGAHRRAQCTACHLRSELPDEAGRTFGRIDQIFGTPVEACATCHADPHGGSFDGPDLPATVAGRAGCARCHTAESFDQMPSGDFDHERWTGYPLVEFHAGLECAACHAPTAARSGERTFAPAAGTSCSDCHADPHVGQFFEAGRTDCARCHADSGELVFDHQRDARFALDEAHIKLECATCHVPWPLPGGGEAVRYKPLGIECSDCHGPRGGVR